jgi:hypothetical protein
VIAPAGKPPAPGRFVMGMIGTAILVTALAAFALMVLFCAGVAVAPPPHSY